MTWEGNRRHRGLPLNIGRMNCVLHDPSTKDDPKLVTVETLGHDIAHVEAEEKQRGGDG